MASVKTENPGRELQLSKALFDSKFRIFEVAEPHPNDSEYLDWILAPLEAPLLASEYTSTGMMDGYFILEGLIVNADRTIEKGYIDLSLPERNIDSHFLKLNGEIVRKRGTRVGDAKIIPAVAIENFGAYDQYYPRENAEAGLQVLRNGLAASKLKWPIALDLGYILRDERRYEEAIQAFTVAIKSGYTKSYFIYSERAKLYQLTGNQHAADSDWQQVELIAGPLGLKCERGF
jgi:tetratricopeptide (TPR) repeat protein